MIQGCMSATLVMLPNLMLHIAYGEEGMKFRENFGKSNKLVRFFMGLLMFWLLFGLLGIALAKADEMLIVIIFTIAPVIIYVVWAIFSRKSVNKQISQFNYQVEQELREEEENRKEGKWKCPNCERINRSTDIICKDCGAYR